MIKLKLRGKHCPVNFTGRIRIEAKPVAGGLLEYELNPDMITDLFDELCEQIKKLTIENNEMSYRLGVYNSQHNQANKKEEYKIGSRFD